MKRLLLPFAVLMLFGAGQAFAQCSLQVNGPYNIGGPAGGAYYTYWMPPCGWSTSGNVSSETLGCSLADGWSFGTASLNSPATVSTQFEVGSEVIDATRWAISANIALSSPDASYWDHVQADVTVVHNGTPTSYSMMLDWNGALGDNNGCQSQYSGYFTAETGDTVYVTLRATNPNGTAYIAISDPSITNGY